MREPLLDTVFAAAHVGSLLRLRVALHGDRPFLLFEGRTYSYRETLEAARRFARRFEALADDRGRRAAVGLYADNTPEFVFAVLGAALSGSMVFGFNTGFRGDVLAGLVRDAELDVLYVRDPEDEALAEVAGVPVEPLVATFESLPEDGPRVRGRIRARAPFLVIYTSGSTGLPKGVVCSQLKLVGAGLVVTRRIRVRSTDRGYVCMPLFHSNAWFLGLMPLMLVGGSLLLRRRFSARGFEDDVLEHGVTYMNYVGQPIHYILQALEAKHGGAVEGALAADPRNRFRIAHGNGATPIDRDKLVRYLGMEHIYELYGSTEAAITTVVEPGDPPDSVGRIRQGTVVVLDEGGEPCAEAQVDEAGRLTNYDAAVGEICRRISDRNLFFEGYYRNDGATASKYRGGHYHSGDLGYVRRIGGRRYLYFEGRTNDWIRKDGENFSAATVARFAAAHGDVLAAVAYGAPAPVADELVMVALKLRPGCAFDPDACFARFVEQQRAGGMDPKWMPDFVRVVEEFEETTTGKILVGPLKRAHFRPPGGGVWFRERGDTTFRPLGDDEVTDLVARFDANGRGRLLSR